MALEGVVSSFLNSPEFAKRGLLDSGQVRSTIQKLRGFQMHVPTDDLIIGREIIETGAWERHVSSIFRKLLRHGMRVLDIGANIGFYTLLSAAGVGATGRVWAIEPNPRNVAFLLANCRLNQFGHVEVIQAAASDRWEVLRIFTDFTNGVIEPVQGDDPAGFGQTVQGLSVSAVLPAGEKIDLIKIDVEGAEGRALRGVEPLLRRCKPTILSEFQPASMPARSAMSPEEYLNYLYSVGYRLTVLQDAGPIDCGLDPSRVMDCVSRSQSNHIDLLAVSD